MTWNPHSAFPRQSTYIPDAGGRGIQRAINAPDFGAVGTGRVAPQQPLNGAYLNIARNAASIAGGAVGGVQQVRGLQGRPGIANGAVDTLHQRAAQMRSNARRQLMGVSQTRPGGQLANAMFARGADVVQSPGTPLSATPPLMRGRPNQPWDSLLEQDDVVATRSDGPDRWAPAVTSRGRPRRGVAPFNESTSF